MTNFGIKFGMKMLNLTSTCNMYSTPILRTSSYINNICQSSIQINHFHTSLPLDRIHGIKYLHGYSFKFKYRAAIPNLDVYTHEPIPHVKTGGRGPDGHIKLKHIGGGLRRPYFMVHKFRGGLNEKDPKAVVEEKILRIHKNWWRSENIALVVNIDMRKRWVLATHSMQEGDIIRSYGSKYFDKPTTSPKQGDAYPIFAIPQGTRICQIERYPGHGSEFCIKAGSNGIIVSKSNEDKSVTIKMTGKHRKLIKISQYCTAVVGQMSNPDHNKLRFKTFGEKTWHGIKQRSGWFQKKWSRFGRKVKHCIIPIDYLHEPFDEDGCKDEYITMRLTKPGSAPGHRGKGTRENPRGVHRYEIDSDDEEEGKLHPKFKYSTYTQVR